VTYRETNRDLSNRIAGKRRIYENNEPKEEMDEEIKEEKQPTLRTNYSRWHMNRSSSPCIIAQDSPKNINQ
jgi:hypothetical protein